MATATVSDAEKKIVTSIDAQSMKRVRATIKWHFTRFLSKAITIPLLSVSKPNIYR